MHHPAARPHGRSPVPWTIEHGRSTIVRAVGDRSRGERRVLAPSLVVASSTRGALRNRRGASGRLGRGVLARSRRVGPTDGLGYPSTRRDGDAAVDRRVWRALAQELQMALTETRWIGIVAIVC